MSEEKSQQEGDCGSAKATMNSRHDTETGDRDIKNGVDHKPGLFITNRVSKQSRGCSLYFPRWRGGHAKLGHSVLQP